MRKQKQGGKSIWGGKGLSKSLEIKSGSIKVLYIWTDLFACLVCIKIITSFPDAM